MTDPTAPLPDLGPQTRIVARLADQVADDHLTVPTPCPDYTVGDLLAHLHTLSLAFRSAALKDFGPRTDTAPTTAKPVLSPDWRTELPKALDALAEAWRDPSAWTGDTRAGGVALPGEVAGAVAADELVVHAWDLARALDLPYTPDPEALFCAHTFLQAAADLPDRPAGLFGPIVRVPVDAPLLDRALGLSGRDPAWRR
ncbi:TIGR03086 family metal-binding protein [Streptomyces sp. NPDC059597]|uniref:TIGR03086 family metal-binding protein n=1 Tax=Streptomyces sp. NPDC059597 TaxID=3346879 RepID=UPI0036764845